MSLLESPGCASIMKYSAVRVAAARAGFPAVTRPATPDGFTSPSQTSSVESSGFRNLPPYSAQRLRLSSIDAISRLTAKSSTNDPTVMSVEFGSPAEPVARRVRMVTSSRSA